MDWKGYEAGALVRQLLQSCTIRDGEILRFHGEGENTGEMVKLLHPRLTEEGYEAVTVSQMVYKGSLSDDSGWQTDSGKVKIK